MGSIKNGHLTEFIFRPQISFTPALYSSLQRAVATTTGTRLF